MGRDAKPNGMLYLFKVCPLGLSLQAVVWQHSLWGLSFCVYMNTFGKWRFWDLYSFLVMRASLGSINAMLTFKAHALGMGCLPTLVTDMAECQIKYWFKTSVACSQCVYGGNIWSWQWPVSSALPVPLASTFGCRRCWVYSSRLAWYTACLCAQLTSWFTPRIGEGQCSTHGAATEKAVTS